MKGWWLICLVVPSCSCNRNVVEKSPAAAQILEDKLRRHFVGRREGDISTLIQETSALSARLKAAGMRRQSNRFDSYVDVLTYGNNTIDESLDDVMMLVRRKNR
jgi:hypothetical protein